MEGFEIEPQEENIQHVDAVETNETAAPGAIDVTGTESKLAKIEDSVKIPVIPDTLNIDGVELNIELLKASVETAKLLKIDGLGDKAGYDIAVAELKKFKALRTGSEKWRKKVMTPILKFQKDLKGKIDDAAALCEQAEAKLAEIIKPIDDAVEIARQLEEKKKDDRLIERGAEMVALGGVFDGQGTYNFPHNPGLFILASNLREFEEPAYLLLNNKVQLEWDKELERLESEKSQKEKEDKAKADLISDLNASRTKLRKQLLSLTGYTINDFGAYTNGTITVAEADILGLNDQDYDILLNPVVEVAPEPVKEEYTPFPGLNPTEIPAPVAEKVNIPSFAGLEPTPVTPAKVDVQPTAKASDEIVTRSLIFSTAKPFVEFALNATYSIRLYPQQNEDVVMQSIDDELILSGGEVLKDTLKFIMFKNS